MGIGHSSQDIPVGKETAHDLNLKFDPIENSFYKPIQRDGATLV
jgi:hypothetical protein